MPQVSFFSPYDQERASIERRRKYAEALLAQSQQGIDPSRTAGGWVVPMQKSEGLSQIAKALAGVYGNYQADQREQANTEARRKAFSEALTGMPRETTTPAIDIPSDEAGGGPGRPAVTSRPQPQDYAQWMGQLAQAGPEAMQIGNTMLSMQDRQQTRTDERTFRDQQARLAAQERAENIKLQREAQMQQLQMRLQDQRLTAQERAQTQRELAQMQIAARRDMIQLAASLRPPRQEPAPALTTIADPNDPTRGVVVDARTGRRIGDAPPSKASEKPMTEFQGKGALYGTRAAQSDKILKELEEKISTTGLAMKQSVQGIPVVGGVLGAAGNVMLSKEQQRVEQAQRDFVNAVLRQESGAVISPAEFNNAQKQYFPQPGDSPEVIEQKRQNRQIAIDGFARIAGPGAADIQAIREAPLLPRQGERRGTADRRAPPAPAGVDAALWAVMTPEERALWTK